MERTKPDPTPHEATVANADLWARYFQDQWSRWLNPFGAAAAAPLAQVAEGTAARVASFLTLVAAGPIARLYSENAALDDTPAEPAPPPRLPSPRDDAKGTAAA